MNLTHLTKSELDVLIMSDYLATFEREEGTRVLQDLKDGFHYITPMFDPGTDAMTLAFREGQRSVLIFILGMIDAGIRLRNEEGDKDHYERSDYDYPMEDQSQIIPTNKTTALTEFYTTNIDLFK